VTDKTISFKMPEDEVIELDEEADAEDKSRSEYLRSIIRARHIEEQLEEQVLTQSDKNELERRVEQAEQERDEMEVSYEVLEEKYESLRRSIDESVSQAVSKVEEDYKGRIAELEQQNKTLRQRNNGMKQDMSVRQINIKDAIDQLQQRTESIQSIMARGDHLEEVSQELSDDIEVVQDAVTEDEDDEEVEDDHEWGTGIGEENEDWRDRKTEADSNKSTSSEEPGLWSRLRDLW